MHNIHHVAVTSSNFERSLEFYKKLGFIELENRTIPERNKKIALLSLGNFKLELFWYDDYKDEPKTRETMGNNVHEIGSKHFAIRVDSLIEEKEILKKNGIELASEPAMGDTGYEYFFIKDPDGIWIEYVQDDIHE
jgi:catechol 2,3-dioxygenase-like lactoylglutathione lyase family enzyme